MALLLTVTAPRLEAQTSDFNAGNDTGWARYTLVAYGAATFSFPADGTGGKAYSISAPPTGNDDYGMRNARAGSFRPDVTYSGRFSAATDLLAWNADWHQEAGLLFYLSDIGLGTSDGYCATYSSAYHNLYISLISDEDPITLGLLEGITLDPARRYRLVASSHDGYTFLFQLFDKADLNNPWASAIAQDPNYTHTSGFCGLFTFQQDYPSTTQGAQATFDNYAASVPAAGSMPAVVTDLTPPPGGKATAVYPTISATILDRDSYVDTASIKLCIDGTWIPNASLTVEPFVHKDGNPPAYQDFSGATVTYPVTSLLPWGTTRTTSVAFMDSLGTWRTNTWSWTVSYPFLPASSSLPIGALNVRGFDSRMVQSANGGANLDNTLERARKQLAIPPLIPIDLTATSLVQVLDWNKNGTPAPVPGLCPGTYINIAVDSLAYLQLDAGLHRFHITTDDRAGVYCGDRFSENAPIILWENPGNTADAAFDVVVETAGLYPIRTLWEETGGSANLALYSVNPADDSRVLVNDPNAPAEAVKAWYPLVCRSATAIAGPYAPATDAVNAVTLADVQGAECSPTVVAQTVTGGTFTVPLAGATRFYRIDGPRSTTITGIRITAGSVVLTYTMQ